MGGAPGPIVGWITAFAGAAIAGSYLVAGDTLPAFVYMPTTLIGLVLLIAPS